MLTRVQVKEEGTEHYEAKGNITVAFRSTCMRILSTSSGPTLGKMEESAPLQKSNVSPKAHKQDKESGGSLLKAES